MIGWALIVVSVGIVLGVRLVAWVHGVWCRVLCWLMDRCESDRALRVVEWIAVHTTRQEW